MRPALARIKLVSGAGDVGREHAWYKGRVLGLVLGTIGRRVLEKAFENSVKAIEARNSTARAARAGGAS